MAEFDGKSVATCLLEACMVKAHKCHGQWMVCYYLKKAGGVIKANENFIGCCEFVAYLKFEKV